MPPAIVTRHLALMCSGPLSVPVVYGTLRTRGLFNHQTDLIEDGTGGEVKRDERVLLVPKGRLPAAVRQNSRLTVDGAAYQVRTLLPQEDGELVRYVLAPITGTPIMPTVIVAAPVAKSNLLLEDTDNLLLENMSELLLEV
jgi:hypothetical protein